MPHEEAQPRDSDGSLERFRRYLELLASMNIDRQLRGKIEPADIVQQTLLEAHQSRGQIQGTGDAALAAWLRRALMNNIADAARGFGRQKRDAALERAWEGSSRKIEVAARGLSPSGSALADERALLLADALGGLPEPQRDAVIAHYLEGRSLEETAKHLGKSEPATAGLIYRGLKKLRETLRQRLTVRL